MHPTPGSTEQPKRLAALAMGAIGVVYGDIGTSPLYAIKETFATPGIGVSSENVLGVLSLMFWALVMVVSLKYVVFIMRADNKGEGGIMALMALAQRTARGNARARWWIMILGLFGASLFYGDGVITPAISVLSAVEGLKVAAPGTGALRGADLPGHRGVSVLDAAARHAQGRQGIRADHDGLVHHPGGDRR